LFIYEYVWLDGNKTPGLRSKIKVCRESTPPVWTFDGSSTNQAEGDSSDCLLIPSRVVEDPVSKNKQIVLCEVYNKDFLPVKSNLRAPLRDLEHFTRHNNFWFGIEQEYTMYKKPKDKLKNEYPLGWSSNSLMTQGPFYCGNGASVSVGRELANKHLEVCLQAGIPITGINAEVMLGQWEFQIFGSGTNGSYGCETADYLWLARFFLLRLAEERGIDISFEPKPVKGDFNGSGAHINISTKHTRDNSKEVNNNEVIRCIKKLEKKFHEEGFPEEYGENPELRLTGKHETCSMKEFRYGDSDRTASIRVPLIPFSEGMGATERYFEDRRPNSNIDPYRALAYIIRTIAV